MDSQFYPTPPALAKRAFDKFENKRIKRLLEPEAGRGDFLDAIWEKDSFGHTKHRPPIDCVEIDLENQTVLKTKKYRVVGHDFMKFEGAAMYSHILMNPPFSEGAQHVLQAWKILFSGELVAILNAETVKNPYNKARQYLCRLIDQHGSVEFVQEAFLDPDTKRKTSVEVAIVYLKRQYDFKSEFLDKLKKDKQPNVDYSAPKELMVGKVSVKNTVLAFDLAVEAAKQKAFYSARLGHYAKMLDPGLGSDECQGFGGVVESFNESYTEIKRRAWSTILKSTEVTKILSSTAEKRLRSEFESICDLEFTALNIQSFLMGLSNQQGEIQIDMLCDVFDSFTRYHSHNRVYYQGWKSNDKHRVNAFRLQTKRIVLPSNDRSRFEWANALSWDDQRFFSDIDKAFAMMDGKVESETFGIVRLFDKHFAELKAGSRLSCDYFDVRFYAKAGTYHLFPTNKKLVDRLNNIVGKNRQWLPEDRKDAPDAFWSQYDQAEKINQSIKLTERETWRLRGGAESEMEKSRNKLLEMHKEGMAKCGIEYDASMLVEYKPNHEVEDCKSLPKIA